MATPAAVLSILVKTQGATAASAQLTKLDAAGAAAGRQLDKTGDSAKKHSKVLGGLGTAAKSAGLFVGVAGFAGALGEAIGEYREAQKIGAQTNAVLKSTGGAANISKQGIEDLANAISRKSGIDDEAIQSTENLLLTFTKIRNETGKGNDIFNQATQAVTDMSVALGQSGKSSAIQLGKALNDPIKGVTALRRVGVSFTEQQTDQIEKLVESGHQMRAQKLILRELTTEFGGSAAAQATAGDKLKVALGNLAEAAGRVLVPAIDKAAAAAARFINEMQDGVGAGGRFAATMRQIAHALAPLIAALGAVAGAIASVTRWLARASANVSLFIEDVRDGTHQTGSFGASLHGLYVVLRDVAAAIRAVVVWVGKLVGKIAGGVLDTVEDFADGIAKIANAAKDAVEWIGKIHFPKIKIPSIPNPFKGGPVDFGPASQLGQMPVSGVDQFTPIASRFGLTMTSGYRPGDPGFHGLNRARDYSNGVSTPQELAFAKYMAATYGSRLKELIHTPLGYGIDNGKRVPLSFWGPRTNAMHYNHVHVAFRHGGKVPGAGSGDKIPAMLEPGEFVMRKAIVDRFGPTFFAGLNGMRTGGMAGGGPPLFNTSFIDLLDKGAFDTAQAQAALATATGDTGALRGALVTEAQILYDKIQKVQQILASGQAANPAEMMSTLADLITSLHDVEGQIATIDAGPSAADTAAGNQDLIDAQNAAAEAAREQTAALLALINEIAKDRASRDAILRSNWNTAITALGDLISGQIAGPMGYQGRASTAGAGSTYRL